MSMSQNNQSIPPVMPIVVAYYNTTNKFTQLPAPSPNQIKPTKTIRTKPLLKVFSQSTSLIPPLPPGNNLMLCDHSISNERTWMYSRDGLDGGIGGGERQIMPIQAKLGTTRTPHMY